MKSKPLQPPAAPPARPEAAPREPGRVLTRLPKASAVASGATPFAPACSIFRRYLRGKSLKFTPERASVLDAVLNEEGLFEAERIAARLREQGHRGSRATVYRTLSHLHEAGILKQVFFDSTQTYYEVIADGESRDHLVCIETGRVVEFSSERLRQLRDEICREFGFEAISHQFQIFGISPEARARGGPGDAPAEA